MIKYYLFTILFATSIFSYSQITYNGNGNTGFGGPVGLSSLSINDNGTTITFTFTKGAGDFNDALVFYLDTTSGGRIAINNDLNDNGDDLRRAITNADSGGNASTINFPSGFAADYAFGIDQFFGGLWQIPETGIYGNNELPYITSLNSTLTTPTQASFSFDVDWSELGLSNTDSFKFVALYLNAGNAFNSDEAYGEGIAAGNSGSGNLNFTSDLIYSNTLDIRENTENIIDLKFIANKIKISNFNGTANISVVDLQGRLIMDTKNIQITNSYSKSLNLPSNQILFLLFESQGIRETLKIIVN